MISQDKGKMSPCLLKPELKNLTGLNYGLPKKRQNELLQTLGKPHVDSFNYMLEEGLNTAVQNLMKIEFSLPNDDKIAIEIEDAKIFQPSVPPGTAGVKNPKVYPTECRQRAATYKGKLIINVNWWLNGRKMASFEKDMGDIPIMLKSKACHLNNLSPADLVKHKEHAEEWGGYFVVKGHERLVRMLLLTRRNYPIAVKRSGWKSRGSLFSDLGLLIRCVAEDQTSTNNTLHFVTDGSAKLMFSHNKVMYYVPVTLMLKCLMGHTDQQIYRFLIRGREDDLYYSGCIQNMLRTVHEEGLHTQTQCLEYIGKIFRGRFEELPPWYTNVDVAQFIIKQCVLIHLKKNEDKFHILTFMTQKLFTLSQNKCKVEGADAVMMQELMLGGHLYLQIVKDKLQTWLSNVRLNLLKRARTNASFMMNQTELLQSAKFAGGLENILESFLSTGNLSTRSGLGLMQNTGLTIVAENINRMRYMSHFRAVHRGAFFTEMRTTEARQLLPDAWGFICPVHTPDGTPCGLLNHLTMDCQVTRLPDPKQLANVELFLINSGMIPMDSVLNVDYKNSYTVILDGVIIGHVMDERVSLLVDVLRQNKIIGTEIPKTLEIVLVPKKKISAQYPGLFLFTGPARMMRPVINLALKQIEMIGTWEQVYLDIAVVASEIYPGVTTHLELTKTAFLSNLANLIPMPDCNQSPRNMYQCQMGKQTMGTPLHYWLHQAETKLYRLQTPATPLFRPVHYDNIDLDDHAMGTNAIIAVISYTGYDMEDAMIINKESYERGFAHGSVYKSEFIRLEDSTSYFCRDPDNPNLVDYLDTDGLPHPGSKLQYNVPYYCFYNVEESRYIVKKYHSTEEAFVDNIRLCGTFSAVAPKTACITIRVSRNPSVGDKFASRAGQKGICSQKWPAQDLPWTETGLVPDIVFNPHGFPSRMTIAMMIECMAGKSAALHGLVHDATPFRFDENDTAIDHFGRLLEAGGYNYYGTERLYSGIDGRELNADIFFGIVHYQRLRHMVSDKWQVRSTGPIDGMTRQPIKGRKRGGGVRFGEMERDSLLSHGASFLLQDRLFHCSDKTTVLICQNCGTLLGPITEVTLDGSGIKNSHEKCRLCGDKGAVHSIQIPYIFKYLVTQFSSVNINVKIKCKET